MNEDSEKARITDGFHPNVGCGIFLTIVLLVMWMAGILAIEFVSSFFKYPDYQLLLGAEIVKFLFTFGFAWVFWILTSVPSAIGEIGLGLDRRFSIQWLLGLLLGIFGITVAIGLIAVGGDVTVAAGAPTYPGSLDMGTSGWLRAALIYLFAAGEEEIVARGMFYPLFKRSFGILAAVLLSSALFTAAHLANNGFTVIPMIDIFLAGIFLVLLRELTGNLWLAWGAHFGWNFALAAAGLPVSGTFMELVPQPFHVATSGPAWLTGGAFGPEGGLAGVGADLVLIAVTAYLLYVKTGKRTAT